MMRHFIPCNSMTAKDVAELFYHYVWRYHGLPESIVSDRGSKFVSLFWKRLCERLKVEPTLSTFHQPETDGQTESSNKILEQSLRCYVAYDQQECASHLPSAEFAINKFTSETTSSLEDPKVYMRRDVWPNPEWWTSPICVRSTKGSIPLWDSTP